MLAQEQSRTGASGSLTTKVVPRPSPSLCTSTVPPCSSTRFFTIDNPSPKPPWMRVVEASACRKRSKTLGKNSDLMPIPESATVISTWEFTRSSRTSTLPSLGVNLIALVSKFQTICCKRVGSPETGPACGSRTLRSRICLASAAGRTDSIAAQTMLPKSTACTSSRTFRQ